MKVSDAVIKFLVDKGIKHVFIISGGAIMHIGDSLNNYPIKYVCLHNEQSLSMCVEAYGRVKEDIGICIVTSGPGGSNAITGVLSGFIDSIPMMVISGQAGTNMLIGDTCERQVGIQEADIISMVKPITKYAKLILDKDTVLDEMEKAYHIAKEGRPGPVWLDIPVDIQGQQIEYNYQGLTPEPVPKCGDDEVEYIAEMFLNAKKPVIQAGYGIRLGKALTQFEKLIQVVKCPVQTTWSTADYLDDNDIRYAGHPGTWGQQWANMITQRTGLLLCLGTRLSVPQTGYYLDLWGKNAVKIVVDIDDPVLKRCAKMGCITIKSDVKYLIESLVDVLEGKQFEYQEWLRECQELKRAYPICKPEYYQEQLNSYVFYQYLSSIVDNRYIITSDVGTSFAGMFPVWRVKKGQRIINSSGLSSMGHGLPSAIGAWFASEGKRPVIMFCGDGGFQMNIQELQTIKHHNIPVKMFIFCNDGYLTQKHTQMNHYKRFTASDSTSGVSMPDFVEVAKGYGIDGYHIRTQDDFAKLGDILAMDKPVLVSVHTGIYQPIVPKLGAKIVDGKFKPVEFDEMIT